MFTVHNTFVLYCWLLKFYLLSFSHHHGLIYTGHALWTEENEDNLAVFYGLPLYLRNAN